MNDIKRIAILGGPGTGKSTLAKNLGKELNLPIYHLDGINFLENWKEVGKEKRDKIILEKASQDKWIIEGTYKKTLKFRLERCDIAIFLDYSTFAKIKGIVKRYIKNKGKIKEEVPGCKERLEYNFFKYTLNFNKKVAKEIKNMLTEFYGKKKILIFKNKKELNKWYMIKFNKKISLN